MKTQVILAALLVIAIGAFTSVLLSVPTNVVASSTDQIAIPQFGASGTFGGPFALTVNNVGSTPVTIATINVDNVAYTFSSTATPGTFSATSNQIAPGQSTTFTITPTSTQTDLPAYATVNFTVVTTNGANATTQLLLDNETYTGSNSSQC